MRLSLTAKSNSSNQHTREFGSLTEYCVGDRLVRVYRGRPLASTGAFRGQRSILTFLVQGEALKTAASETAALKVGSIGLMRYVDVEHIQFSKSGATWLNVELGVELAERANRFLDRARRDCVRSYNPLVIAHAARLVNLLKNTNEPDWDLEELLAHLIDAVIFTSDESGTSKNRLAEDLRDLIDECFGDPISFRDACEDLECNPSHAGRVFRRRFGCSPGEYLRHVRFTHAFRRVLNSDDPLVKIANACGFFDESHLCRTFQKFANSQPMRCRKLGNGLY